jgi:hypothetical protein
LRRDNYVRGKGDAYRCGKAFAGTTPEASAGGHATVDAIIGAGDELASVRRQQRHDLRDVFGSADAAERYVL